MIYTIRKVLHALGSERIVLQNFFWLTIADCIAIALKFLFTIFIARELGVSQYGVFIFLLALVTAPSFLIDFGITQLLVREISSGTSGKMFFYHALRLKFLLSALYWFVLPVIFFFIIKERHLMVPFLALGASTFLMDFSGTFWFYFRARFVIRYEVLSRLIYSVLVFSLSIIVVQLFQSVVALTYGYAGAALIAFILTLYLFKKISKKDELEDHRSCYSSCTIMKYSLPFAIFYFGQTLLTNLDLILLTHIRGATETGYYAVANKIISLYFLPALFISQAFFTVLAKLFKENASKFTRYITIQVRLFIMLFIPLCVGGYLLAGPVIHLFYSDAYEQSILLVQILVIAIPAIYMTNHIQQVFVIAQKQHVIMWITVLAVLIDVILNSILIPKYGMVGAAMVVNGYTLFIFFAYVIFLIRYDLLKYYNIRLCGIFFIHVCVAATLMAIGLLLIRGPILIRALCGLLIYSLSLFLLSKQLQNIIISLYFRIAKEFKADTKYI